MANKKVESVIHADGVDIAVVTTVGSEEDYISLTDMARHRNPVAPKDVVKNWLLKAAWAGAWASGTPARICWASFT